MAKTKKTEAAVPETAPELEIPQDPYQELMAQYLEPVWS